MARKTATAIENNFIQGLITEKTALTFPENACTETDNCIFKTKGNVTRRTGIDLEDLNGFSAAKTTTQSYRTYLWEAVGGSGNITFLVLQSGRYLYFFNQTSSTLIGINKKSFTVDLEAQRPVGSNLLPSEYPCAFSSGNGDLFVVNYACNPFYIEYTASTDSITTNTINVMFRDFDGYDDGLDLTARPTETVASLKTNNPKHYYNIINQGWHASDALTQWDTALATMPSNADQVGLFRASETDSFDATKVTAKSPGNSPAPKGHFILNAANPDRVGTATAEGFSFTLAVSSVLIPQATGSIYTDFNFRTSSAFDGVTASALINSATKATGLPFLNGYIGKTYTTPITVAKAIVNGTTDSAYAVTGAATAITLELWGKLGTASPVLLGTLSFNQTNPNDSADRTITSTDTTSLFDTVYIKIIKPSSTAAGVCISELRLYTVNPSDATKLQRHTAVAFLGNKVYYSGLDIAGEANKIWFSQIITNKNQYGKCYQKNDPTSEDYFELLADDGGVIKVLEIGNIVKLFPLRSSLVVFATNGVWLIGGSNGVPKATEYTIKKLSGVGTTSPNSIVDVKGMPIWWAEDGIYTMQYDPNYDSFQLVNLTQVTIKSFILGIPQTNRKYVVGTYDPYNEIIMWMYNDSANLTSTNYSNYNKVLCLNTVTKAFYTWTIGGSRNQVRTFLFLQDAQRSTLSKLKYVVSVESSLVLENIYFAEHKDGVYQDWSTIASILVDNTAINDYTSYFVTGYKIHGETQKFTQPGYCFVFLNQLTNSSCYLHARYDYTNDSSEGKWSSVQQVYNSALTNRNVNFRRLKIRGKGRAMQMKFESESGKPFDIIGWSMRESSNGDI